METKTIIAAHNGFHKPLHKEYRFRDTRALTQIELNPTLYSIVAATDGSVTLTEYATPEEYTTHRDAVFEAIARFHATHGKQPKCQCSTCKGVVV